MLLQNIIRCSVLESASRWKFQHRHAFWQRF